ncbi:hypothetical protein ZWY2020_020038 [Hordeum vulgare]|nr:hypothetical protein ZWY2020_020038 [Hordeum vulgare]
MAPAPPRLRRLQGGHTDCVTALDFSSDACNLATEIQDNDPSKLIKSASERMSLRKYDGALGLLNVVLELDPNHSEAYRQRASVLRHRCRHKEAESDYNKFLELKPGTALVEKELAQLLQAQNALESAYTQSDAGEFSKVLEYVNKIVLVFSPGCLKALSERPPSRPRTFRTEESIFWVQKTSEEVHTMYNVQLYLGLCKTLVKLGRGKEAINSRTEALNIHEELVDALAQRGEAKLLTEDWEGVYIILGISKTKSAADIKPAYKRLALQWHLDKNVENREEAENMFREITAAYEVLRDEDKRVRYDRGEDLTLRLSY